MKISKTDLFPSVIILLLICIIQFVRSGRLSDRILTLKSQIAAVRTEAEGAELRASKATKRADVAEKELMRLSAADLKTDVPTTASSAAKTPAPRVQAVKGVKGMISASSLSFGKTPKDSSEPLVRNAELADQAYQFAYSSLGILTPEQKAEFLKLKIKQLDTSAAERQAIVNRMQRNSPERDILLDEVRQRTYETFIEDVRRVFGEAVAEAVDRFETTRQLTTNQQSAAGSFDRAKNEASQPGK